MMMLAQEYVPDVVLLQSKRTEKTNGRQRYYCHDCFHSFNERTGTLLHCSHMTGEQWKRFIDLEVSLDTEYRKINRKGTKPKTMPRISKKRGNSSSIRGILHHKISVICALDSNDHMIMRATGLGDESFDKYRKIENYFKDAKIISDSKTGILQFANLLNARNDKILTSPIQKRYQHDRKAIS